jgi:hypothetical protein
VASASTRIERSPVVRPGPETLHVSHDDEYVTPFGAAIVDSMSSARRIVTTLPTMQAPSLSEPGAGGIRHC